MESYINSPDKYYNFQKILIFGDKQVGKSAFVKRISKSDYESAYVPSQSNI
jgi:GTPase SAR1 family protein